MLSRAATAILLSFASASVAVTGAQVKAASPDQQKFAQI